MSEVSKMNHMEYARYLVDKNNSVLELEPFKRLKYAETQSLFIVECTRKALIRYGEEYHELQNMDLQRELDWWDKVEDEIIEYVKLKRGYWNDEVGQKADIFTDEQLKWSIRKAVLKIRNDY